MRTLLLPAILFAVATTATADTLDPLKVWLQHSPDKRPALQDTAFGSIPLTKDQAVSAAKLLWDAHRKVSTIERAAEMEAKRIVIGDHTLRFETKRYGKKPKGGWNLYISMHGGGNTRPAVNDRQWQNQIKLGDAYAPKNAIYVAPRAPTDTWNLWHQSHIDALFDRLIENLIALEDVNPNRVYIMGYSAGGDGVYQLAPRMADRLAAAAMSAGHPNETSPLGLRNIGFALHMGALDNAYKRNAIAAQWGEKLAALRKADPDGYAHQVVVHEGKGHWMEMGDKAAIPFTAEFTRDPHPAKLVWKQDDTTHDRFYWAALSEQNIKPRQEIVVSREGQTFTVQKAENVRRLRIRLNDAMIDFEKPIRVIAPNGKPVFAGTVSRTAGVLAKTLTERGDPAALYSAEIEVRLPK